MEGNTAINQESIDESLISSENDRSWVSRTFGKLDKGALRGAIFSLVSTAIGAGCLTLPLVFKNQGIILACCLLTFTIALAYYGLVGIALAGDKYRVYNYISLVEIALGKNLRYITESAIILFVFGSLIGYQIMIGIIMPSVAGSVDLDFQGPTARIIIMVVVNLAIMTPLSMFKELSSLRFVSLFNSFSLIYISLLILAEFPLYAIENSWSSVQLYNLDITLIYGFNLCLFSANCHTNISQIQGELFNSNIRRIKKVSTRAMLAVYFPYMGLGLFGYLSTLDNTPDLIIMRQRPSLIPNDFLMVIGRFFMAITLTFGVPVNIPPCRLAIIKTWFRYKEKEYPLWV